MKLIWIFLSPSLIVKIWLTVKSLRLFAEWLINYRRHNRQEYRFEEAETNSGRRQKVTIVLIQPHNGYTKLECFLLSMTPPPHANHLLQGAIGILMSHSLARRSDEDRPHFCVWQFQEVWYLNRSLFCYSWNEGNIETENSFVPLLMSSPGLHLL